MFTQREMKAATKNIITAEAKTTNAVLNASKSNSGNLEKIMASLEEIKNAEAVIGTLESNKATSKQAYLNHTILNNGCEAVEAGYHIISTALERARERSNIQRYNREWSRRGSLPPGDNADLIDKQLKEIDPDKNDNISLGSLLSENRLDPDDERAAIVYNLITVNGEPERTVERDGTLAGDRAYIKNLQKAGRINIKNEVFSSAIARRKPMADTAGNKMSWMEVVSGQIESRFNDQNWAAAIQAASGDTLIREGLTIQALQAFLTWELFKEQEKTNMLLAISNSTKGE